MGFLGVANRFRVAQAADKYTASISKQQLIKIRIIISDLFETKAVSLVDRKCQADDLRSLRVLYCTCRQQAAKRHGENGEARSLQSCDSCGADQRAIDGEMHTVIRVGELWKMAKTADDSRTFGVKLP